MHLDKYIKCKLLSIHIFLHLLSSYISIGFIVISLYLFKLGYIVNRSKLPMILYIYETLSYVSLKIDSQHERFDENLRTQFVFIQIS